MAQENRVDYIEQVFEFRIPKGQKPERIDRYLTRMIQNATRTKVQRAILDGRVVVNGVIAKSSRPTKPDDNIVCTVLKPPPMELVPQNIPLEIVHEDENLMVINKPAGMVVHPGFGNRYGTVVNAVLYYLGKREAIKFEIDDEEEDIDDAESEMSGEDEGRIYSSDEVRPGIVHRIDKDTSGLLLIAKDADTHAKLAAQFAKHTIKREYWAIVWGKFPESAGTIEGNIGRSLQNRKMFAVLKRGGKHAKTDYFVMEEFSFASLVKYKLHTGRTHQIRVHSTHLKHPIMGDEQYGGNKMLYSGEIPRFRTMAADCLKIANRQLLHAKTIGFVHPQTHQELFFESELPLDFREVLSKLQE